jgi:hypothetical protein
MQVFECRNSGRLVCTIAAIVKLPSGMYTLMARIKNEIVLIRDVHLEESRRTIHFAYGR